MAAKAPFTAYFRTIPARGDSKWDYVRDLQHLGIKLYTELEAVTQIVLPIPGGGQNDLSGQFGSIANGTGVRPQIGNNPSLLMIEGFYNAASDPSEQPVAPVTLIHCNEFLTGPRGERPWGDDTNCATSTVVAEVKALRTLLDTAALAVTDDSDGHPELFRLTYKNIIWGDSGHHWPLP